MQSFHNSTVRQIWGGIPGRNWQDWRWQIASRLTDISRLADLLKLAPGQRTRLEAVAKRYPFCVTPYYLSLCDLNDPCDPIRRQFFPAWHELRDDGTAPDPLGERRCEAVPGLIHRYRNRVVLVTTMECAVRCRHCTRKNTLESFAADSIFRRLPAIVKYIRRHPQIREALVSGGDPLLLETAVLDRILGELRSIRNIEVLRIGTRVPVVLPMRIDGQLCDCLQKHRPLWVNTQFNHPREITPEAAAACRRLQETGLPVSNQAVLLRGLNDSFAVLAKLCNELQRIMVRPYYVFQCDGVRGTKHFSVPLTGTARLARRLRSFLGGLSMPLFVADIPGRKSKVPLETVCHLSDARPQ